MKPLAEILRPLTIKNIVGQSELLQSDGLVNRMVVHQFGCNLIFYGPPGVGKTTFAYALGADLHQEVHYFNASVEKKENLDKILKKATMEQPVALIIDEVQRMNQNKQDILLEYMEKGLVFVYFTTTENPYFVINPALRSRSTILELKPISSQDMFTFFKQKLDHHELELLIDDETLMYLCELANGDLRVAINKIELLLNLYPGETINPALISKVFDHKGVQQGGRYGDTFHDLKSALQKSVRGSDVDAALYYFARMLSLGEHEALMRRMLIMAYEDIGLANPVIPMHVYTACQVFRNVGMPEGVIPLGLVICEMALSIKSNSAYLATQNALNDVSQGKVYDIPAHLKDSHYASAKKLKRGGGYKYAHNYPNDWVEQQYLPDELKGVHYYQPKLHSAYEKKLNEIYESFKKTPKKG